MSKNFPSSGALDGVRKVVSEARKTVSDPSRTWRSSAIGTVILTAAQSGDSDYQSWSATEDLADAAVSAGVLTALGMLTSGGAVMTLLPRTFPGITDLALTAAVQLRLRAEEKKLLDRALNALLDVSEAYQSPCLSDERATTLRGLTVLLRACAKKLREDVK